MVAGGFAAWIAGYGATGRANPWPWPWLLVDGFLVALGVIAIVIAEVPRRPKKGGADFVMRYRAESLWELEYVGPGTAFDVTQGDGVVSGSAFVRSLYGSASPIGDMTSGSRQNIYVPNVSSWVWLHWIAGDCRYYSKSQLAAPGGKDLEYVGIVGSADAPFQT